jgi:hypothetical protein
MATPKDYQIGSAALAVVIAQAIKDNVPEMFASDVPQKLVQQIDQLGAKAVIDAVDNERNAVSVAGPA